MMTKQLDSYLIYQTMWILIVTQIILKQISCLITPLLDQRLDFHVFESICKLLPRPPPHVWQWHKLAWQDANMLRQFWWGPKTKTQMIFQTKLVRVTIYLSCHSHKCVVQMLERLGKAPTRHRYGESQYRWSNSRRHKLQFCQISS